MPNRFPTEAANADILGEGPGTPKAPPQRPPRAFGNDGMPRGRASITPLHRGRTVPQDNSPKPGKD